MFSAALRHTPRPAPPPLWRRECGHGVGHPRPQPALHHAVDIYTHAFGKDKKAASAKSQKGLEIWNALIEVVQLDYSHTTCYT